MTTTLWHSLVGVAILATASLGLMACDDSTGGGEEDTCTGLQCNDAFFRDVTSDTGGSDTSQPTDTGLTDTGATCIDGTTECVDATTMRNCVGGEWSEQLCLSGQVCDDSQGQCVAFECPAPGQPYACEDSDTELVCNDDQLSGTPRDCTDGETCTGTGCGAQACEPRSRRCLAAENAVEECLEDGSGYEIVEECAIDERCSGDVCTSLCELNAKQATSFLGCEYYVVDMDNETEADDTEFGITISNSRDDIPATVNITGPAGYTNTVEVAPLSLEQIALPTDSDVEAPGIYSDATFFVTSNVPVTVHQFNPLNQSGVASNDASLLLPVNAVGSEYFALGMELTVPFEPDPGQEQQFYEALRVYVDIVGTVDNTTVTVTSPVDIPGGTGFGDIPANVPTQINLGQGDLVHLVSEPTRSTDLSGMQITTSDDTPVVVLAGSRCASIPDVTSFCDHIEQQLFPANTWGTEYVAAKFNQRGTEVDVWKVIASEDDTTVSFDPPQGMASVTLNRGEVHTLESDQDFTISADKPILAGQFMVGSNYPGIPGHETCEARFSPSGTCTSGFECFLFGGDTCTADGACVQSCSSDADCQAICQSGPAGDDCRSKILCNSSGICAGTTGIGDPAYSLAVPVDQYRAEYIVMVPSGYEENYLTLITQRDRPPQIDGTLVVDAPYNATPTPLGDNRDIYRIRVGEGVHTVTSSFGFGVMTYGYECDVSYAYPGGLNLQIIN